tara:strand:+ start:1662 stop:1964 length:303 start_codon:yes stop_codon:yes gene_type:complete
MKNRVKNYIVSSANWEYEIDDILPESAAVAATILAFGQYQKNLCMSTIIMVNRKEDHLNKEIINAEFFSTSKILNKIGMTKLAKSFSEYTQSINEIKYIK